MPGMTASAVMASRQFKKNRMVTAIKSRSSDRLGDTTASCNRPEVVSMSPLRREMIPPVFMSESFCRGK